ncbi:MAG: hypothetical protein JWQ23_2121 [Herminiimonas sp.]|nr:hypothetical protein [Herminiimonas sp.]
MPAFAPPDGQAETGAQTSPGPSAAALPVLSGYPEPRPQLKQDRIASPALRRRAKVADAEKRDWCGCTALMRACETGPYESVDALLQSGANVNAVSKKRNTALIFASTQSDPRIVRLLITHGANIEAHNNLGETALALAVEHQRRDVAAVLLEHGANAENALPPRRDLMRLAIHGGDVQIARMLMRAGLRLKLTLTQRHQEPDETLICTALERGDREMGLFLLGLGVAASESAFVLAVEKDFRDCVALLCSNGMSPDIRTRQGVPVLHVASEKGYTGMVQLLCDAGAQVNQLGANGATALIVAARFGHVDIMRCLLAAGAHGTHTFIVWIAERLNSFLTPAQVSSGVNLPYSISALKYAVLNKNMEAIELLLPLAKCMLQIDEDLFAAAFQTPHPDSEIIDRLLFAAHKIRFLHFADTIDRVLFTVRDTNLMKEKKAVIKSLCFDAGYSHRVATTIFSVMEHVSDGLATMSARNQNSPMARMLFAAHVLETHQDLHTLSRGQLNIDALQARKLIEYGAAFFKDKMSRVPKLLAGIVPGTDAEVVSQMLLEKTGLDVSLGARFYLVADSFEWIFAPDDTIWADDMVVDSLFDSDLSAALQDDGLITLLESIESDDLRTYMNAQIRTIRLALERLL